MKIELFNAEGKLVLSAECGGFYYEDCIFKLENYKMFIDGHKFDIDRFIKKDGYFVIKEKYLIEQEKEKK